MLQSCFVNEVHLNAEVTLGMSCVRISALELQDNDNFRLTLSRVFHHSKFNSFSELCRLVFHIDFRKFHYILIVIKSNSLQSFTHLEG